jgi:hypothetical protein
MRLIRCDFRVNVDLGIYSACWQKAIGKAFGVSKSLRAALKVGAIVLYRFQDDWLRNMKVDETFFAARKKEPPSL